ncbi:MAG: peptidase S10 [Candidatus Aminicenantes bacterium]|nr:peptidase S10 [Candidatus Aminicenantes bacterium]
MVLAAGIVWGFDSGKNTLPEKSPAVPDPVISITKHSVRIGGQTVPYTATIGKMRINKPDEKPGADVFFTAYTRDAIKDISQRPITFAYNGGPGSSSVWLHMGGIGPKRVRMTNEGFPVKPPYGLEDNEYSLLDVTDLVFIDPVSTGFSRPLPGEKKSQFHGVYEDISSVGEFIRMYITYFERWSSPKFLLGESYGTYRSAGLSGFLQGRQHGMYLNGIILVSSVLDFSTIGFAPGSTVPYVLFLPHYTATARYHGKLSGDMQQKPLTELLDEVEEFALNEYSVALLKGNRLDEGKKTEIVRKLAMYTGLSEDYIRRTNLRIRHDRFVKELLRDEFQTVGRLDSRFIGMDEDAAGENYEFDPSSAAIQGPFSTMFNEYIRRELGFPETQAYHIYGDVRPWNFTGGRQMDRRTRSVIPNMAETLRTAMSENTSLRVFAANGYYDGATPYFETEYTFSQIGLNGEFKDRVTMGYYEAGHMMYIHKPSLIKLKEDLARFIKGNE